MTRWFALLFVAAAWACSLGCGDDDRGGDAGTTSDGAAMDAGGGTVSVRTRCVTVFTAVCERADVCGLVTGTSTQCFMDEVAECCMGAYCVLPDPVPGGQSVACADAVSALTCEQLDAAVQAMFPSRDGGVPLAESLFPAACSGLFRYREDAGF